MYTVKGGNTAALFWVLSQPTRMVCYFSNLCPQSLVRIPCMHCHGMHNLIQKACIVVLAVMVDRDEEAARLHATSFIDDLQVVADHMREEAMRPPPLLQPPAKKPRASSSSGSGDALESEDPVERNSELAEAVRRLCASADGASERVERLGPCMATLVEPSVACLARVS